MLKAGDIGLDLAGEGWAMHTTHVDGVRRIAVPSKRDDARGMIAEQTNAPFFRSFLLSACCCMMVLDGFLPGSVRGDALTKTGGSGHRMQEAKSAGGALGRCPHRGPPCPPFFRRTIFGETVGGDFAAGEVGCLLCGLASSP